MFNSLPPEIFHLIIEFATIDVDPDFVSLHLSSYSLVCKSFLSARRELWKELTIRNGLHLKGVLNCIQEELSRVEVGVEMTESLGEMVRNLHVRFQASIGGKKLEIPNEASVELENMVSYDDFISLVQLLPNVTYLQLYLPTFTEFSSLHLQHSSTTLFPLLNSLHLTSPAYDTNQSLLRQLLQMAPITSLELFSSAPFPATPLVPLNHCRPLYKLIVWGSYWERVLFDLEDLFIPLDSFDKLEELQISAIGGGPFKLLPEVVIKAGESLRIFDFAGTTTSDGLIKTFKHLKVIRVLDIWIRSQREDLLQLIPSTVKHFVSPLSLKHLIHFANNPRPELRLDSIAITSPSDLFLDYIPKSVKRFTLLNLFTMSHLLLIMRINRTFEIGEKSQLKEIYVIADEADMNDCREGYREIGIDLRRENFLL